MSFGIPLTMDIPLYKLNLFMLLEVQLSTVPSYTAIINNINLLITGVASAVVFHNKIYVFNSLNPNNSIPCKTFGFFDLSFSRSFGVHNV